MQDITPPDRNRSRRSVRDISPPSKKSSVQSKSKSQSTETVTETESSAQTDSSAETAHQPPVQEYQTAQPDFQNRSEAGRIGRRPDRRRSGWLWSGVAVVLLAVFLGAYLFSGAEVVITPRQQVADLEAEYRAVRDHLAADNESDLTFSRISERAYRQTQVAAEGREEISRRATGQITIYNEFSDASQTLIATTRFEDPQGRIFRMPERVTVPGITADGQPGTVTVEVEADEPGEEYNIEPTEFTLPGFKEAGAPQYDSIYGKATESFTGGYQGARPIVSEDEQAAAETELKQKLEIELTELLQDEVPEDYYLIPETFGFEFDSELRETGAEDSATLEVTAEAYGLLLDVRQLSRLVARDFISDYEGGEIRLENIDELKITVLDEELRADIETLDLLIDGRTRVVWLIEQDQLRQDLARTRRTKDNVDRILRTYENQLLEVEIRKIRPPWRLSLPAAENIRIVIDGQEHKE